MVQAGFSRDFRSGTFAVFNLLLREASIMAWLLDTHVSIAGLLPAFHSRFVLVCRSWTAQGPATAVPEGASYVRDALPRCNPVGLEETFELDEVDKHLEDRYHQ